VAATAGARFDRMVPAAPDAVGALRRALRRWARAQGASPAVQANVALAFSEAATSIIGPDGPRDRPPGPLSVEAWVDGDDLHLHVLHRSGASVALGYGFGMAIIARICDEFEIRRREDQPGSELAMTFRLERSRRPARSSPPRPSRSTPRR
jgi:anti-sigma regulatory factor (Ser/Thr protein kinase)